MAWENRIVWPQGMQVLCQRGQCPIRPRNEGLLKQGGQLVAHRWAAGCPRANKTGQVDCRQKGSAELSLHNSIRTHTNPNLPSLQLVRPLAGGLRVPGRGVGVGVLPVSFRRLGLHPLAIVALRGALQ